MDPTESRDAGSKAFDHGKHYRRPRRRPAYLRTKTGCLTCRVRKKKCDEANRPCGNCARIHLTCRWPREKHAGKDAVEHSTTTLSDAHITRPKPPPSTGIHVVQFGATDLGRSGTSKPCYRSLPPWSPKGAAVSLDKCSNAESEDFQGCISKLAPSISMIYSTAIAPESVPLFDFLRSVFLPQLIRPAAQKSLIDFFSNESLTMALRVPFLMHALLACCGAEILVEGQLATHYRRLAEMHYAKALAGLRASLETDQIENDGTVILRAVIMLCIYERSKPYLSHGVDAHLLGMAQLIAVRFQQPRQITYQSMTDMDMDRVILEAFIFHASTSMPFQHPEPRRWDIDLAFSLAEQRLENASHRVISDHSLSPILGVPPKLFACAREIALIHQGLPNHVDLARCHELMDILSALAVDMFGNSQPLVRGDSLQGDPVDKGASIGPRLYILVSRILLDRIISLGSGNPSTTSSELLEEAVDLVNQLQPPTDYYAEYYGWPIQVLGAYISLPEHRNCLLRKVTAFWKATRNGTMGRLMRTLS